MVQPSEAELDALAAEGISCKIEGDKVVCNGIVIQEQPKKVDVPVIDFSVEAVRKLFEAKP